MNSILDRSPLGKKIPYKTQYDSSLLFAVDRKTKRSEIGIDKELPFHGLDYWTAYEISWLDPHGKPVVAIGEIVVPCESPHIFESKSIKLYLHSFNQSKFDSLATVQNIITADLSAIVGAQVYVSLSTPESLHANIKPWEGVCLDTLPIETNIYHVDPKLLTTEEKYITETVYSHLLKSNCLITNQPDWGSVLIHYSGKKISHDNLLKYIISYREHNGFHEHCIENIFIDLLNYCKPDKLTVYGRYTRRGGLDISPFRSNFEKAYPNDRTIRQ